MRQGIISSGRSDWPRAAGYYQTLAQLFPASLGDWKPVGGSLGAPTFKRIMFVRATAFETHLKDYTRSPGTAAALYWLGRMAEDHGAGGAARKLYGSVAGRYGQSYYAALSAKRLARWRITARDLILAGG